MLQAYEVDSGRGIYWDLFDEEMSFLQTFETFEMLMEVVRRNEENVALHTIENYRKEFGE